MAKKSKSPIRAVVERLTRQPAAPTRESLQAYWALVDEIALGERSQFRESNKTRAEIEAILEAAQVQPYQLSVDVEDLRGRYR